jgi:hypothetical protein
MRTDRTSALLLAASFLSTLTHSLHAQSPEALERQRAVAGAVEGQLTSTRGRAFHVTTDKPLYRPGEVLWFRAWEVVVRDLSAATGDHGVTAQLLDPRGAKVAEKRILSRGGVATNDFPISPSLPGGSYTLRIVSELGGQHDHPVQISTYEVPRLKKSVEFTRASYAPGDVVTALIHVEKVTGEPLTGTRVTANITLGSASLGVFVVPVDGKGDGVVRFQVPPGMRESNLMLTLNADAGGIVETLQKRVPVVLDQITVSVFPEGGDLVAGLPSRVYLMARDDQGKPAEVEGKVVDDLGAVVAAFKSVHDGMARFALTPRAGRSYAVRLSRPGTSPAAVPAARPDGCVLRSEDDHLSRSSALKLTVACSGATKLVAAATLREKLLASAPLDVAAGTPSTVELPLPADAVGAVRVTLFDDQKRPLAERLVYRGLGRELRVQVTADRKEYSPRDRVTLTVKTTTAEGKPVAADVALAVVDDAVLRLADSKAPHLLAELYLLHEMPGQRIHEPNFYFSGDKKAPEAMDLLVATQGYRRFSWAWVPR